MGNYVHDVLKKIVTYYIKNIKKSKNKFLVMISNFYHLKKWNIEFTRNEHTFRNSYLFQKKIKNMSCIWTIIKINYKKIQKISKTHLYGKIIFGQKDM